MMKSKKKLNHQQKMMTLNSLKDKFSQISQNQQQEIQQQKLIKVVLQNRKQFKA